MEALAHTQEVEPPRNPFREDYIKHVFQNYPNKGLLEKFIKFHKKNPHIWSHIQSMVARCKGSNSRIGMKAIIENLRWDEKFRTKNGGDFKMPNAFTAPYANLYNATYSEFFNTNLKL